MYIYLSFFFSVALGFFLSQSPRPSQVNIIISHLTQKTYHENITTPTMLHQHEFRPLFPCRKQSVFSTPDEATSPKYSRTSPDYTSYAKTSPDYEESHTPSEHEVIATTEHNQPFKHLEQKGGVATQHGMITQQRTTQKKSSRNAKSLLWVLQPNFGKRP